MLKKPPAPVTFQTLFFQFLSIFIAMQPSSSFSFSDGFKYQVFLSFRGSDTRNGFIAHLYKALTDKGIHTFIDDNNLQRGYEITPSLVNAIEESRIPLFSINYASSFFCLDELVHILHCCKTKGCLILPIFYGMDPTHVRHLSGSYGEHLTKHEERFRKESNVEIISLNCGLTEEIIVWNGKAFEKMRSLKTLIIQSDNFFKGSIHFPSNLRVLKWENYPSNCIPASFLNKMFENMKILKFNNCEYLTEISDVSCLPNLKIFSFKNCENLNTIHSSVGLLTKLESLNAGGCIKLKSFPPLNLPSLKKLKLSRCKSLQTFPEILGKIETVTSIDILETSIGDLPVSFQNLTGVDSITIDGRGMFKLSSFISKMPKLYAIYVYNYHLLISKSSSTMSSNVKRLYINKSNLSDECLPIVLGWFSHLGTLHLNKSNIKILPEFLKECVHLHDLNVDDCKFLEEVRGIPPNLACFSAVNCESLNSSSRSMLVNQELHDCRETKFCFPGGSERVPKWFEHQSIGPTRISVWFRKKIPLIILFFSTEWPRINFISEKHRTDEYFKLRVNLFTNGHTYTLFHQKWSPHSMLTDHIYLNYFDLEQLVHRWHTFEKFESKLDEAFLKNEWIHMELKLERHQSLKYDFSKRMKPLRAKFGIHVLKFQNNLEDIKFTNPYRKRKSDQYLNTSLSQFYPILKKQRFVDMEGFEAELGQNQQRMSLSSLILIGLVGVASLLARLKTRTVSCSIGFLLLSACFFFCFGGFLSIWFLLEDSLL